jgi:hypothetical protein
MEPSMTSGTECQSSTNFYNPKLATVSAMLGGNEVVKPVIYECENFINPESENTNEIVLTENSRAPPEF